MIFTDMLLWIVLSFSNFQKKYPVNIVDLNIVLNNDHTNIIVLT